MAPVWRGRKRRPALRCLLNLSYQVRPNCALRHAVRTGGARAMWLSDTEWTAVSLSLAVALRSVLMSLPPAIAIAWLLARRRFPGRTLFDAFVHLPLVLPPVAVGYVLLILFGRNGPLGAWLERTFGLQLIFTRNGAALA